LLDEAAQIVGPVFHNPPKSDETRSFARHSRSIEPRAVHAEQFGGFFSREQTFDGHARYLTGSSR
jgi:hypothetical protein